MNTVCAAVVALSLVAVGRSAPLACETLVRTVERGPDVITGNWYVVAISTETWWHSLLINVLWPSSSIDITAKGPLNTYDATSKVAIYDYCINGTETFAYVNNGFLDGEYVEGKGYPEGSPDVLLQTDCHDCLIVKEGEDEDHRILTLMSRRKSVTIAEMEEFKKQAECIGWSKPQVLNANHETETENCKTVDQLPFEGVSFLERTTLVLKISSRFFCRVIPELISSRFSFV